MNLTNLEVPGYYRILQNCHSLEKLAMENNTLNPKHVNFIGKNGQTLKVLNLANVRLLNTCGSI